MHGLTWPDVVAIAIGVIGLVLFMAVLTNNLRIYVGRRGPQGEPGPRGRTGATGAMGNDGICRCSCCTGEQDIPGRPDYLTK